MQMNTGNEPLQQQQRWSPAAALCSASQLDSFAYESTVKRWPAILTGVVSELAAVIHLSRDADLLSQGQAVIAAIGALIYEMRHDRQLLPLPLPLPLQDNEDRSTSLESPDDIALYNSELQRLSTLNQDTWFSAPWLYAECYMYRRLRTLFAAAPKWYSFDPFAAQKVAAFQSSAAGIMSLAESMQTLLEEAECREGCGVAERSEVVLQREWEGVLSTCLWGNATDLSLLTSLTHEEIQALQSVERGSNFILKKDDAWPHIKNLRGKRIDIVLDNSGFELFTDFVLADWLVTFSPFCTQVVFHPKNIPWFVSDVIPADFTAFLDALIDAADFFPSTCGSTQRQRAALREMVLRWTTYVREGKFVLSVNAEAEIGASGCEMADFWTSPLPFSDLPAFAPELLSELQKAELVIFKGDLNYRKLTGDACWPTTTAFGDTLGPLRGKINILSLRTCKATVVVGLQPGTEQQLDSDDPTWRVSGKYAVVSFSARD